MDSTSVPPPNGAVSGTQQPSIRPASLHESVAARLRAMIFDRQLAPGELVDEVALARDWGISRTPMREALKVLAAEGLVVSQARRGCVVTSIGEEDAARLFPVMALLEGRCAYEAALNASEAELAELQALHAGLEHHAAAGDIDGYYRANHVFHTRVQAIARNPWLSRAIDPLRVFLRMLRGRQLNLPGRLLDSIGEHRALLRAMLARDAQLAGALMHDHLIAQWQSLEALRSAERQQAARSTQGSAGDKAARRSGEKRSARQTKEPA